MKEYQKHIKDTHADRKGKAICGATLEIFDWAFMDVDHAFVSLIGGSRLLPCPACAKAVLDAFAEAAAMPPTEADRIPALDTD